MDKLLGPILDAVERGETAIKDGCWTRAFGEFCWAYGGTKCMGTLKKEIRLSEADQITLAAIFERIRVGLHEIEDDCGDHFVDRKEVAQAATHLLAEMEA